MATRQKNMANDTIKREAKAKGVYMWEIADKMEMHETTLLRHLRHELPEAKQRSILEAIDEIAKEKGVK